MKKIVTSLLAAVLFSIFSLPATPALAAGMNNRLWQDLAQQTDNADVKKLLALKQLTDGGRNKLLEGLAQSWLTDAKAKAAAKLTGGRSSNSGEIVHKVEALLRQQGAAQLADKIAANDSKLQMLATLLQQAVANGTTPAAGNIATPPAQYKTVLDMTATAYAPGSLDNGIWKDKTYLGTVVKNGVAAVDPQVIPMGSRLWIEGYGEAIAADQGSAIKGPRIDLAFDNRQMALDYGIKHVKVYVLS